MHKSFPQRRPILFSVALWMVVLVISFLAGASTLQLNYFALFSQLGTVEFI
jgi:hypothetical protein